MTTFIFCHGLPGCAADVELLQTANPACTIKTLDVLSLDPDLQDAKTQIADLAGDPDVHLIGFSIGAMVAIKIAAANPDLVTGLTLVSPAAPLSTGDFLPNMAGKPVFDMALKHPRRLKTLTWAQGLLARVAPNLLINALFAKCGPTEKDLLKKPAFLRALAQGFTNCFVHHRASYLAFIQSYVEDWSAVLPLVRCPVTLWHGTSDTWSPPAMSQTLTDLFGHRATFHGVPAAEHYSTLQHVRLGQ